MKDILIVVSTFNRRDLTGITLSGIKNHVSNASDVIVLDDASTEYSSDWITRNWGFKAECRATRVGVGEAAAARYRRFIASDYRYLCALDNDIILSHHFDLKLLNLWHSLPHDELTVVTGYRSKTQQTVFENEHYAEVTTIGGVCHFVDRISCWAALNDMPSVWPHNWDSLISRVYCKKYCTAKSLIQHLCIFGSGVNGESKDTAVNSTATLLL